MSKSNRNYDSWDEYDDYGTDYQEMQNRRKQKRMTNVLRSKNIQELLRLEEEDDED